MSKKVQGDEEILVVNGEEIRTGGRVFASTAGSVAIGNCTEEVLAHFEAASARGPYQSVKVQGKEIGPATITAGRGRIRYLIIQGPREGAQHNIFPR